MFVSEFTREEKEQELYETRTDPGWRFGDISKTGYDEVIIEMKLKQLGCGRLTLSMPENLVISKQLYRKFGRRYLLKTF